MHRQASRRVVVVGCCASILVSAVMVADEPGLAGENIPNPIVVDSVRALSATQAEELEGEITRAYATLAPSVVRLWKQNEKGEAFDESGVPIRGGVSGVIIDRKGLILTCSHHGEAPGAPTTIELADGKRVSGTLLGRFQQEDLLPLHVGPDLGLAKITEPGEWPAATVDFDVPLAQGQIGLSIGYPGTLRPGRPPLLRVGRITPSYDGSPWLESTASVYVGDSGGPLFDLEGQVVGILACGDGISPTCYQTPTVLKAFRERLEASEIVSAETKVKRLLRATPPQPAPFVPLPELEDQILQVQHSVVRLMDGPNAVAAGLIVDPNGWAVTKASLVGSRQEWSCRLNLVIDKTIVKGRVVATSPEHDIALMKVDVQEWPVPVWSESLPVAGTIVSSPLGRSAGPVRFSVVGADTRDELSRPNDFPQLPVPAEPDEAGAPVIKECSETAEFDAYRELFQPGDIVTHLNGIPTPTMSDYGRVSDRLVYGVTSEKSGAIDYSRPAPGSFAGEWVTIGIRRGTQSLAVRVPKIDSSGVSGSLEWHCNPRSLRRHSFPTVFPHDGRVRPQDCGGPVVDLKGRVIGLNIACADTTRTLAIPTDVLRKVISELRQQADIDGK